jgi:glutaredoxin
MPSNILDIIPSSGVFFFSKATCKYCIALEQDLIASGTEFVKYSATDQTEANNIKKMTGRDTFPILYINKLLVGGYNEYLTLAITNQLACNDF